ncbi:MAG TPA: Arm DNA-binding domain-containing protein, partial [Hyphomicrobiales bacterium]|nr:Arm DNA-binding domain-containing protein [Hyphomicrobiales bacterium]
MRLTKRAADAVKPANTDISLWDSGTGSVPGFGLRVRAGSGSRTFVFMYRNRYGKFRRLTLGRYGKLTIDQARVLAKQAAAEVAAGGDPAAAKQRDRSALLVNDVL